jgi:hypothetical protein
MNTCELCGRTLSQEEVATMRRTGDTDCPGCGFDFYPPQLVAAEHTERNVCESPGKVYSQCYKIKNL